MGHTGVSFLEDDRLMFPLIEIDDSVLSCIAHNTVFSNLKSILLNGLAPGGDGITKAVHSQLSAFHRHDARVHSSSLSGKSDAVIIYNVGQTNPLLDVTASGVLAESLHRGKHPGAQENRCRAHRLSALCSTSGGCRAPPLIFVFVMFNLSRLMLYLGSPTCELDRG